MMHYACLGAEDDIGSNMFHHVVSAGNTRPPKITVHAKSNIKWASSCQEYKNSQIWNACLNLRWTPLQESPFHRVLGCFSRWGPAPFQHLHRMPVVDFVPPARNISVTPSQKRDCGSQMIHCLESRSVACKGNVKSVAKAFAMAPIKNASFQARERQTKSKTCGRLLK